MAYLELKNVSKGFGGAPVLKDINLAVEKGEFVAIVGFSGAGKTTLINLITGLLKPDTGEAKLNDLEITGPGPDRGIVFQNYSLLPWLTVFENIFLAVEAVNPNWAKAKMTAHVEKYIAMVNLTPARDKKLLFDHVGILLFMPDPLKLPAAASMRRGAGPDRARDTGS